jgi:hypothetical protein
VGTLPELNPVVAAPWFDGPQTWPWPIADRKPYSFIRLSGRMSPSEVGLVLAQLVKYNRLDAEQSVAGLLTSVIADERLLLPGGVQASLGECEINPSCCCGLEEWRSWSRCLASGESPWMGHDPAPRIEWSGASVRVWSDGGLSEAPDAFAIVFERRQFVAELERVERELRAFLPSVRDWSRAIGFSDPEALCHKLDTNFGITAANQRQAEPALHRTAVK